jgi:hypothetical protein
MTGCMVDDVVQSWVATWPNQVVPHGTMRMPNDGWVKIIYEARGFEPLTSRTS